MILAAAFGCIIRLELERQIYFYSMPYRYPFGGRSADGEDEEVRNSGGGRSDLGNNLLCYCIT
jgi:hypothetical protein